MCVNVTRMHTHSPLETHKHTNSPSQIYFVAALHQNPMSYAMFSTIQYRKSVVPFELEYLSNGIRDALELGCFLFVLSAVVCACVCVYAHFFGFYVSNGETMDRISPFFAFYAMSRWNKDWKSISGALASHTHIHTHTE